MPRPKKSAKPAPEAKGKPRKAGPKRTPRTKQALERIVKEAKERGLEVKYGRPSIYPKDAAELSALAERIYEHATEGKSFATISCEINIPRITLQKWAGEHEEFMAVLARAKDLEQKWWEEQAKANLTNKCFNAHVWSKSVSARFRSDYGERAAVEMTGKDGKDLVPEQPADKLELARWLLFVVAEAKREAAKQQLESPEDKG